jgi:cell division protein FtsW
LVVYLAYSLTKKRNKVRSFSVGLLPHLGVASLMAALVLKEPDLGNAAIMLAITLLLLTVAGTKLSYVMIAVLSATPVAYQLIVGTPWRLRRLLAFLDPWAYRKDAGYQVAESLISIGSGGGSGRGLGAGKQKLFFLPAAHTDFIFAIIGEELGLLGLGAVVLLFAVLLWRGLRASIGSRDLFGSYLAFGIISLVSLQALMHMAVVLGLVPTKGITLPVVSYGGSALITNLFCLGVVLNIAARKPLLASRAVELRAGKNRRRASRVVIADEG